MLSLRTTLIGAAAALTLVPAAAQAEPHMRSSWDFNDTFVTSYGSEMAGSSGAGNTFGSTTLGGQSVALWHFAEGGGLRATAPGLPLSSYSVAAHFRLADVAGRNRVLGFGPSWTPTDDGLYIVDGQLAFDNGTSDVKKASPTAIAASSWHHVVLTRSGLNAPGGAEKVSVYLDGVLEFSFTDSAGDAQLSPDNGGPTLFADEGTEESAGDITRLQTFDGPLSAAQVATLQGYDATAPTASLSSPAPFGGVRYFGPATTWKGTISDDGTVYPPTEVWLEDTAGTVLTAKVKADTKHTWPGIDAGEAIVTEWSAETPGPPLTTGQAYRLAVRTVDGAGNERVQRFDVVYGAAAVQPVVQGPITTTPPPVPPAVVVPPKPVVRVGTLQTAAVKALRGTSASAFARRGATVPFTAPVPGTVTIKVLAGRKVVASGRKAFAAPGAGTITVKAGPSARKALRRARKVVVRTSFAPVGGAPVSADARVTLKR